jgi:hypothetical protein
MRLMDENMGSSSRWILQIRGKVAWGIGEGRHIIFVFIGGLVVILYSYVPIHKGSGHESKGSK